MRRLAVAVLVLVAVWGAPVPRADEGMWIVDNPPQDVACTAVAPSAEPIGRQEASKPTAGPDEVLAQVRARLAPDPRVTVFRVAAERRGASLVVSGDVERDDMKRAILDGLEKAGHRAVVDEITVVPDPALGDRRFGIVTVSVAHIRSRTSQMADQVTELLMGSTVRLLRRQGGWYYAQHDGDRYLGWIEAEHVATVDRSGLDAWRTVPRVMTTAMTATVRERPEARAWPVSDLVIGNVLRDAGRHRSWQAVELPDGRKGYVERDSVQNLAVWERSRRATPEAVEATARQFLGVPYLWGGTSAKGFDCSGFVKTVYWLNGVGLPRDADQQGDAGEAVPIDGGLAALQKGDLLFFVSSAGRTEPITHVALYVGHGEYLHASGLVKRNSLDPNSPIYSEGLLKRLVGRGGSSDRDQGSGITDRGSGIRGRRAR